MSELHTAASALVSFTPSAIFAAAFFASAAVITVQLWLGEL
jgi:hypothetical protein